MNKYIKLKAKHQAEYNAFPTGAAFNQTQFNEMMAKWGLSPDDTDKIYHVFAGVYIRKSDHKAFHEMLDRFDVEIQEAIAADADGTGFIYDMFYAELANHEYGYTRDITDAVEALGYTFGDLNADKRLLKGLKKAMDQFAV